jgi:hypothetical protein
VAAQAKRRVTRLLANQRPPWGTSRGFPRDGVSRLPWLFRAWDSSPLSAPDSLQKTNNPQRILQPSPAQTHRRLAHFCHNIALSPPQARPAALILPYSVLLIPDDRQALGTPTSSTPAAAASRNPTTTRKRPRQLTTHLRRASQRAVSNKRRRSLSPTLTTRTARCVG